MIAQADTNDTIWQTMRQEAQESAKREPLLASHLHATILNHKSLESALAFLLANKLSSPTLQPITLMELFTEALEADEFAQEAIRADIQAVVDRDPACDSFSTPFLYFKGYHGIQSYRIAHTFWTQGRRELAMTLQSRMSEVLAIDIHPAARIGKGLLLDHATSVVVGETAVIKDNVSMLHEVTLGGTGKERGNRHPKIGEGVLIGAGAKLLGNINIGDGAKIGAGSVVLSDIPAHATAVGVPAKVVGQASSANPAFNMDHSVTCPEVNFGDGI